MALDDPDLSANEIKHLDHFGGKSVLSVPMIRAGEIVAIAEIWESRRRRDFSESEITLAHGIAQLGAIAVENVNLYDRARREIEERLRAEAELAEERALLTDRVSEQTAELRQANSDLARAARLKNEFLASMSHELRTPLNAILGISEGLRDEFYGPLNGRQQESLQMVDQSGHHLLALIDDILDVSRIESGKLELNTAAISVDELCLTCLQLVRQSANKKQITVSFSNDGQVTHILADPRRLKQILINLLSNAVKFTADKGSVGLEIKGDIDNNKVDFIVWDTGIGIATEDLPQSV